MNAALNLRVPYAMELVSLIITTEKLVSKYECHGLSFKKVLESCLQTYPKLVCRDGSNHISNYSAGQRLASCNSIFSILQWRLSQS